MEYSDLNEWNDTMGARRCTLASLAHALREIPRQDSDYGDDLAEIVANQPANPEPRW